MNSVHLTSAAAESRCVRPKCVQPLTRTSYVTSRKLAGDSPAERSGHCDMYIYELENTPAVSGSAPDMAIGSSVLDTWLERERVHAMAALWPIPSPGDHSCPHSALALAS